MLSNNRKVNKSLSHNSTRVKLGDKEQLDSEQPGNTKPFPVTNLPVYFVNSEQPGITEQFCDGQKLKFLFTKFECTIFRLSLIAFKIEIRQHSIPTTYSTFISLVLIMVYKVARLQRADSKNNNKKWNHNRRTVCCKEVCLACSRLKAVF